ncbi:hypothetical protein Psta_2189 [Pirellula staleyi DSM 6068]|uniref:Uncharacterized protein n=1 Tax=Pirellula staleyi (strain ATCC 27377 / DSM 6068 / ICPB 4128) TaxID=530564 RepID=D2R2M1_PIRSD|nr:hypothetical protein [Pirellula staleyi]ADB16861.1 hypothetical protein Psta_2189 [Pirellula staleyi DSM 6068]
MHHAVLTQRVRELVAETFSQLGLKSGDTFEESILIRAGHYCGRRFTTDGGHAVWFVEENVLKFYTSSGTTIRKVEPSIAAETAPMMVPNRLAA